MLHKTRGIVLHVTDYSETSVVARVYTEVFGVQSYLVKGARRKKSKTHAGILQPMSLLEMEVYHKDHGGLQYAAEMNNRPPFQTIPYDMAKTSVALFINEIVYKSLREEESNPMLFDFLHYAMRYLDSAPLHPDFHLLFMIQFSRYLGFFPHGKYSGHESFFDLQEGRFQSTPPGHPQVLEPPLSEWLSLLLSVPLQQEEKLNLPKELKSILTERLIDYYSLHLSGFGNVKSQAVLEAVWS